MGAEINREKWFLFYGSIYPQTERMDQIGVLSYVLKFLSVQSLIIEYINFWLI